MVEQSSIAPDARYNNPPDTNKNVISVTLNNLLQSLATLHTGNQNTRASSSHAPLLDPFVSTQNLDISSSSGSTAFQLACAMLNVT